MFFLLCVLALRSAPRKARIATRHGAAGCRAGIFPGAKEALIYFFDIEFQLH
jgi:hypothetical protein